MNNLNKQKEEEEMDEKIIYRTMRIEEGFQFHLQNASLHHKLHVLNNYTCLTNSDLNLFNITNSAK